jgi:phosphoglycerate dehydrogenase-like enzyme
MFFIHFGSVIAWLTTLFAATRLGIIAWVYFGYDNAEEMAFFSKRYLVTNHPFQAVDKTALVLAFGVLTGVLVQIAKNTRKD